MDKNTKKVVHMVTFALTVIGALNWGLVGLMNVNVVQLILSPWPALLRIVYILVGLSAVYLALTHINDCKICSAK